MAALSVAGVAKSFGDVRAVAGVSVAFEAGRIHAVAGENGAGKSTLLRIAAGLLKPDHGAVRVGDVLLRPHTAGAAARLGVAMVQQHFALVGALSALENFILGAEPTGRFGRLDLDVARRRAIHVADTMGMPLPWDTAADHLSVGQRQRLEILRALARDAQVIILDEPTAVLTPGEAESLYLLLRRMADAGRTVIVVTHRLGEVRAHADRVVVLRHGRLVADHAIATRGEATFRAIVDDVMGHQALPSLEARPRARGEVALSLRGIYLGAALHDVSLKVHGGEIVGVAGVEGNGQRELVGVVAGLASPDRGERVASPRAVVYADRQSEGLVLDASVADNLVLGELQHFSRFGWIDSTALAQAARQRLEGSDVAAPLDAPVRQLSGGNQQKIVLARALARVEQAALLVLAEPTRGLDPLAARTVHRKIAAAADRGRAVLLVSTDLSELRALSDRILVLARGRIVADLPPDASDARFGEAMLGTSSAEGP